MEKIRREREGKHGKVQDRMQEKKKRKMMKRASREAKRRKEGIETWDKKWI